MNLTIRSVFTKAYFLTKPFRTHRFLIANIPENVKFGPIQEGSTILYVRCKTTSKVDEDSSSSNISKELDSTDPDSIYAKVKYEEKVLSEDTKGHDGIASSPDHFSSLHDNESNDSLSDKIKRRLESMFTNK